MAVPGFLPEPDSSADERSRPAGRSRSDGPITYQPEEPPLEMSVGDLRMLRRAVEAVGDAPGVDPFERFVLYHGIPARHFD